MKPGPKQRSLAVRLNEKIEMIPECGCWIWMGHTRKTRHGEYGLFRVGSRTNMYVHRASWLAFVGDIPPGRQVLHRCDTPSCVNPHHLFLGTPKDNMKDMCNKGRNKYKSFPGESNGNAKLTKQQVDSIRNDPRTQQQIAKEYQVGQSLISKIKRLGLWNG